MKKHTTTPQQDSGMMTVSIPRIEQHEGYPGNIITIEISNKCPICGGKRGEPHKVLSYDGSRRLEVDGWQNPCGHIDKYESVRQEYLKNNPDINDPDFDPTRKDYEPEPAKEVLQDKHTQGKWTVLYSEEVNVFPEVRRVGDLIAICPNENVSMEEAEANAELICKAVNNYQSLVEQNKKVKESSGGYVYMPKEHYDELINALQKCQDYFDYMKGHNHVASRDARETVKKVLKNNN
jgi:hypothetical protein